MSQSNVAEKVSQLHATGFCVLESVFDADAIEHQRQLLYSEWERRGSPALTGFGMGLHPLLEIVPDIAPHLDCPAVNDVLDAAFESPTRLCHVGARVSSEASDANIGWHHHYGWDDAGIVGRPRLERVLVGFYVLGISPEQGSLCVIPRRAGDALGQALGEPQGEWPGMQAVAAPPGSAIVFDTAVYHTAMRGQSAGMRYLWGCHYQPWSDPRPHGEDHDMSAVAADSALLNKHPGLARLLVREAS